MLVATFNATTGWAGRQIIWQDERFVLDGHGPITAADVVEYDRQGHLDWPSEEMHSWAAARLAWEQAVVTPAAYPAVTPANAQPVVTPANAQPVVTPTEMQPVITPAETQPIETPAEIQPVVTPESSEPATTEPITTPVAAAEDVVLAAGAAESAASAAGEAVSAEPSETGEAEAGEPAAAEAEASEPAADSAEPAAAEPVVAERAATAADEVHDVLAPAGDVVDIVGESNYQEALAAIAGDPSATLADVERWAHLIPEPNNPYDRNAVAVYIEGRKVGYLPRDDSPAYAALLGQLWADQRGRAVCRAMIGGGRRMVRNQLGGETAVEADQFGVKLALAVPAHFVVSPALKELSAEELAAGPPPV